MENLYLFALALAKCGFYTGLLPGILSVSAAEYLVKRRRVSAPKVPSNVVRMERQRPCREWRSA